MVLVLIPPLLQYQAIDNAYVAHVESYARVVSLSNGTFKEGDWNAIADDFKEFYKTKDMFPTKFEVEYGSDVFTYDWRNQYDYIRADSLIKVDDGGVKATISLKPQVSAHITVPRSGDEEYRFSVF